MTARRRQQTEVLDEVVEATEQRQVPQIHIRFQGRSIDIPQTEIDIGGLSTDDQVRTAVANYLEVPTTKLAAFAVDRHPETGNMTLRPEAVFA